MGHDGAKRGHDSAKMGHDSAKMGILSSTWELLGQFWEHFSRILGDGPESKKHLKTLLILIFGILENGLGEHNFDSCVGFIAKVISGSIGHFQQLRRTSIWTISRRAKNLIKPC